MRKRVVPRTALAIGALSTAVLAPTALATSTHEEYVAQVNPICKDATRQAKKIPSRITETGDPFADSLREAALYAKLLGKTVRRIAAVEPAPGEEVAVKTWLDTGRRAKRLIDRFLRAVSRGNAKRAKVMIKRFVRAEQTGQEMAAHLGLPACARTEQPG